MTLLSILAAGLPMLAYVMLIGWLTRYDRPPLALGALVFLWGATLAPALALGAEQRLAAWLSGPDPASIAMQTIVVAPLVEEALKGMVLLPLLAWNRVLSMSGAAMYGALSGLGFAMTENVMSFTSIYATSGLEGWLTHVAVRTLFTSVMHSCATATFAAFVARFRHHVEFHKWISGPLLGLLSAVIIHAGYNGGLIAGASGGFERTLLLLIPLLILVLYVTTQLSLFAEQRLVRMALNYEAREHQTFPSDHASIIASVFKRRRENWLDAGVERESYIIKALHLSSLLHQQRHLEGHAADVVEAELDALRSEIQALLDNEPDNVLKNEPEHATS